VQPHELHAFQFYVDEVLHPMPPLGPGFLDELDDSVHAQFIHQSVENAQSACQIAHPRIEELAGHRLEEPIRQDTVRVHRQDEFARRPTDADVLRNILEKEQIAIQLLLYLHVECRWNN
jgi:hypothetical protein